MNEYYDEFATLDNRHLACCYKYLKENLREGSELLQMLADMIVIRFVYENTEHSDDE